MRVSTQTYATHRRFDPLYHYFVLPILLLYILYNSVKLIRVPDLDMAVSLVISMVLFILAVYARIYALKAQDRVIRLEMRLRLAACLPEELRGRIDDLTMGQIVALRFAPDEELPDLVRRTLLGGMANPEEIKKQIKKWVPDLVRI